MNFRSSSTEIWRQWWWRSSGWLCRCSPEERHRATWRESKTHPIFKVHLFLLISSISEVLDFQYFKHIFLNYYFCDFWFSPSLLWTSDFELRIFQVSLPTFELRIFLVVLSSQDQIVRFRLFCWRSTIGWNSNKKTWDCRWKCWQGGWQPPCPAFSPTPWRWSRTGKYALNMMNDVKLLKLLVLIW